MAKRGAKAKPARLSPKKHVAYALLGGTAITAAVVAVELLIDISFTPGGFTMAAGSYGLPLSAVAFECPDGAAAASSCTGYQLRLSPLNTFINLGLWSALVGLILTAPLAGFRRIATNALSALVTKRTWIALGLGAGIAALTLAVPRTTHDYQEINMSGCSPIFCSPHYVNKSTYGLPLPVATDFSLTAEPQAPTGQTASISPATFLLNIIFFALVSALGLSLRGRLRRR